MAAMREKYRLYHLHLFAEVMIEEMSELLRSGFSPLGVGHVMPLAKELQKKIDPLLMKAADRIKEASDKMIAESVAARDKGSTPVEWMRTMLEELRTRVSAIETPYALELGSVTGLIREMEDILAGKDRVDEKQ